MSRQHYKALAQEISLIRDIAARELAFAAVTQACELFNPRFDRRIFRVACGL